MTKTVEIPTGEDLTKREVGKQPYETKPSTIQPITLPSDINSTFKDFVSHAVFDVDFNELQQLMEIASRGQISIKEKEMLEKSEKNEELAERLEEFISYPATSQNKVY